MLFLTREVVLVRRKAGIAMLAGLVAYWLAVLPIGPFALALLVLAFVGLGLAVQWLDLGQKSTRFKFASGILFLAFLTQVRASVLALRIAFGQAEGYNGQAMLFLLATHLVPVFLLLGLALSSRDAVRRRESILLWVSFALSVALFAVGMGNGAATFRGDATTDEYRQVLIAIRSLMLLPGLGAAIFMMALPRVVMTDEQVVRAAEEAAAAATVAAQRASESHRQLVQSLEGPEVSPPRPDLLTLLEERLARGEISESTYLMLRKKYADRQVEP